MKKTIFIVPLLGVFGLVSVVAAAPNGVGAQTGQQVRQQDRVQDPAAHPTGLATPAGNQVQNQNQIATQNQGEETQLQVTTRQMQQLMEMDGLTQSLGTQIKNIAAEQVQAQNQIQAQVNKLTSRSGLAKKLFGPDYQALRNLEQLLEQNRLRIQLLTELQSQVANRADQTQLQVAVQALVAQNTGLQEQIQAEVKTGSLFGWLVRLFYR